jgi:hypothetical protein
LGMPIAFNPRKKVLDLAGLNDVELALGRATVTQVINRRAPDLVYLPLLDYVEMLTDLKANPDFRRRYELFPKEQLHVGMDVAIRRDSKYYGAMRAIINSR